MPEFNRDHENRSERQRPIRPADDLGAVGDREVPLTSTPTTDLLNRWLDGEIPEPANVRGDAARAVEFWRQIGDETDRRRRMVTPSHLSERIMASLPPVVPQGSMTPWHRKETRLSNLAILGAAAGLIALGVVLARLIG